ncbi:clavesin-1 isoform X2 [Folsomia candida]|uniref:clavesin-1 isoform X2 n=1 Tax=Folsomia candida TaxID=158441 RepID=UPI001604D497|nr:clavesin-1 isoform X2 [Folsomia candida]
MERDDHDRRMIQLRSRIKKNEKLSPFSDVLDDRFLLGFLRGKKFEINDTINCLEHYIYTRTVKYKSFLQNCKPSQTAMVERGLYNQLRERDHLGRFVWITHMHGTFPRIGGGLHSFSTCDELVMIIDCKDFSFNQARRLSLKIFILAIELFFKCIPCRPKSIHFVNENILLHGALSIMRPLLDTKLKDRHVSFEILPVSLGGTRAFEEAYETDLPDRGTT